MHDEQLHTLEFLLAFDGHVHWYEQGYFTKFEVRKVPPRWSGRTACATPSRCTTRTVCG